MIAKTTCQHCTQHIEFDIEAAGQFVDCPSCGQQTRLLMPKKKFFERDSAPKPPDQKQMTCRACEQTISVKAKRCVRCGEPYETGGVSQAIIVAICSLVGLFYILDAAFLSSENIMQQSYVQARFCFGVIIVLLSVIGATTIGILRK